MAGYDFSTDRVLVYHVRVYDYGEILIDIRRVPFYDYDHVMINLVPSGIGTAANNDPIEPVVMDIRRVIGRRRRRIRRSRRFAAPQHVHHNGSLFVSRNIPGVGVASPIGLTFRPLNREQIYGEDELQPPSADVVQDFSVPRGNSEQVLMSGQQVPLRNSLFFQPYFVNNRQLSNGILYNPQQAPVNEEQMPTDKRGNSQQAPVTGASNSAGQAVLTRHVLGSGRQAVTRQQNVSQNGIWAQVSSGLRSNNVNGAVLGGQAAGGRVVVENIPIQSGCVFRRRSVNLGNAEENEEQSFNLRYCVFFTYEQSVYNFNCYNNVSIYSV